MLTRMTTPSEYREEDRPIDIEVHGGVLRTSLADGRIILIPLSWYPVLANASDRQLEEVEFSIGGVHWDNLDADLSVEGMLRDGQVIQPLSELGRSFLEYCREPQCLQYTVNASTTEGFIGNPESQRVVLNRLTEAKGVLA